MKESSELLDLCKQVYEATGWEQSPNISQLYEYWDNYDELCVISIEDADGALVPAYTSDYLLEKLPLEVGNHIETGIWHGGFRYASWQPGRGRRYITVQSDTPLKALLKLVIALDDAGVKL